MSTACFGFVSEISHEQFFTAACLVLRFVMGMITGKSVFVTACLEILLRLYEELPTDPDKKTKNS